MTTEEYAIRELRLGEIRRRVLSRRFGLRAMKWTLVLAVLYGIIVILSSSVPASIRDHLSVDGLLLYCGIMVVIFSAIAEYEAHMRSHLADVMEAVHITNQKLNEKLKEP